VTGASRWVFPFDPPVPPGEGDNLALAVNTVDGTVVYDVAIAGVWVTDDEPVETASPSRPADRAPSG
jgi:putative peptide zinc metalloprotease protein